MKNWIVCALLLSMVSWASSAEIKPHAPNAGELRIVPVPPSTEGDNVNLYIMFPKADDIKTSNPVTIEMRIEGYPIGIDSDFPRKKEIYNDPEGQSIHIIIDNEPYFEVNEAFVQALDDSETYYDQYLEFDIPMKLKPGQHIIRMFPVRSFGESLKGDGCFYARTFYFQQEDKYPNVDLSSPYITYNEPQGVYPFNSQPILLDFYLTNCMLSADGYKVILSIDGKKERVITRWIPHYIYGLSQGDHTIHLQLIDAMNKPVSGAFNSVQRDITLK